MRYIGDGTALIIDGEILPPRDLIDAEVTRWGAAIAAWQERTGQRLYEDPAKHAPAKGGK